MKLYKQVSQRDFSLIKALVEAKIPAVKIKEITTRSTATIARIKQSANLTAYKKLVAATNEKYHKRTPMEFMPDVKSFAPVAEYDQMRALYQELNQVYSQMNAKLQVLIDRLEK